MPSLTLREPANEALASWTAPKLGAVSESVALGFCCTASTGGGVAVGFVGCTVSGRAGTGGVVFAVGLDVSCTLADAGGCLGCTMRATGLVVTADFAGAGLVGAGFEAAALSAVGSGAGLGVAAGALAGVLAAALGSAGTADGGA